VGTDPKKFPGLWAAISEFVLLAIMMAAVPLVIALDTVVLDHGVQEMSVTEFTQKGLLVLCTALVAMTARKRQDSRGFLVLVAGFFGVMLIRESDWLFDLITPGFWIYPALVVSVAVIVYAARQRGTVISPMITCASTKPFAYLAVGLLLVLVFSRTFGTGRLWAEVMGADYHRIYKSIIQEGIELLGYVMVFFGAAKVCLLEKNDKR
jgi:hypothetical protein